MANRGALKISTILQALFGVLIAAIVGSLALPIYGAWQQRARNGEVVEFARAGYAVFIALQAFRSERGPTRVALAAPDPASQSFVAMNDRLHTTADGAMADVTIIDPNAEWTLDIEQWQSKSRNCPFNEWKLKGRATHTIVGGDIKWSLT